jgi:diacylglycerol kinase
MSNPSDPKIHPQLINKMSLRAWIRKFSLAAKGIYLGSKNESSFWVHYPCAIAVILLGFCLGCRDWEWCLLLLCIALVIAAELMNSALERLAHAFTKEYHPEIAKALDIASGAVLVISVGSGCVGLIILLPKLLTFLKF